MILGSLFGLCFVCICFGWLMRLGFGCLRCLGLEFLWGGVCWLRGVLSRILGFFVYLYFIIVYVILLLWVVWCLEGGWWVVELVMFGCIYLYFSCGFAFGYLLIY